MATYSPLTSSSILCRRSSARSLIPAPFVSNSTLELANVDPAWALSGVSVALPPSEWIGVDVITKEIQNRIDQFAHQPTIRIRDSSEQVFPGTKGLGVAGAVYQGEIYLFRDQLQSLAGVRTTLFHELLHYGLRRFLNMDDFVRKMRDLALRDAFLNRQAAPRSPTAPPMRRTGTQDGSTRGFGNGSPGANQTRRRRIPARSSRPRTHPRDCSKGDHVRLSTFRVSSINSA